MWKLNITAKIYIFKHQITLKHIPCPVWTPLHSYSDILLPSFLHFTTFHSTTVLPSLKIWPPTCKSSHFSKNPIWAIPNLSQITTHMSREYFGKNWKVNSPYNCWNIHFFQLLNFPSNLLCLMNNDEELCVKFKCSFGILTSVRRTDIYPAHQQ